VRLFKTDSIFVIAMMLLLMSPLIFAQETLLNVNLENQNLSVSAQPIHIEESSVDSRSALHNTTVAAVVGVVFALFILFALWRIPSSALKKLEVTNTKLTEDEQYLRALIDEAPVCVKTLDRDGHLLSMNSAGLAMIQADNIEQVKGASMADLIDQKYRREFVQLNENVFAGKQETLLFSVKGLKGRPIWLETYAVPFRNAEGKVTQLLGITLDVTKRMQAEEASALRETALKAAANTVVITDTQGTIQWVNPAFTKTTGYTFDEAIGQNPRILKSGKHNEAFYHEMWDTILSGQVWHGEFSDRKKDGSIYFEEATITPVKNQHGEIMQFIAVKQDITDRMQAQKEEERLRRELQQAQKMEALGHLTGGIAHDFNNLLGIIIGNTDLAQHNALPEDQSSLDKYLDNIRQASDRASKLVAQMLNFSRHERASGEILQLSTLLKQSVRILRSSLPASIEITTEIGDNLPNVRIDSTQLNQILMNLASNARDAMDGKGLLTIRLDWVVAVDNECISCHKRIQGDWVELSVSDIGKGISPKVASQMFDPFFTTRKFGEGTGMGMSVIHGTVKSLDGHILLETELGKGTTFRILFPSADRDSNKLSIASKFHQNNKPSLDL